MKIKWLLTIIVCALVLGIVTPADADQIIFQERLPNILDPNGYGWTPGGSQNEGTADDNVNENGSSRALNFGLSEYSRVGDTDPATIKTLLRWDISGLKTLPGAGEHIALRSAMVRLGLNTVISAAISTTPMVTSTQPLCDTCFNLFAFTRNTSVSMNFSKIRFSGKLVGISIKSICPLKVFFGAKEAPSTKSMIYFLKS